MKKYFCAAIVLTSMFGCGKKSSSDDTAAATCLTTAQATFKDVGCSKSGCHASDGTVSGYSDVKAFMSTQALYNASNVIACVQKKSPCNSLMISNMATVTLTAAQSATFTDCK